MRLRSLASSLLLLAAMGLPSLALAQDAARPIEKKLGPADIIMPHITDSKSIEYPCLHSVGEWACEYTFATHNVTVGGHTFDLGLTKHIFFMMLAGVVVCILLIGAARAHVRATRSGFY